MKIILPLILILSIIVTVGVVPAYAQFNSWITFETGIKEVKSLLAEDRIERLKAGDNNPASILNQELRIEMLQAQKDELFKHANDQTIKRGLTDTINDALLDIKLNNTSKAIQDLNVLRGAIHCDAACESTVDSITNSSIRTLENNGRPDVIVLPDAHYTGNVGTILVNNYVEHHASYSYNIWFNGHMDNSFASRTYTIENLSIDYFDVSFEENCEFPNRQNCLLIQISPVRGATIPDEYEFTFELKQVSMWFIYLNLPNITHVATFTITDS